MENILSQQIEEILAKSEGRERKRTMDFFHQVQSIEPPPRTDRAWLYQQFKIHQKALKLSEGSLERFPIITFAMGRAYERYYVQKKKCDRG